MPLISSVIGNFASANRYELELTKLGDSNTVINYSVKGVELPGRERKTVDVMYKGVKYPVPREIAFKNTTEVVFYLTEDGLREEFFEWMKIYTMGLDDKKEAGAPIDQFGKMTIIHFESKNSIKDARQINQYDFHNVFPTEVSPVSLSNDNNGLLEFTVTFAYSHFN